MGKFLLLITCLFSSITFAQSIVVEDGLYEATGFCAHRITSDLVNKKIYMQGVSVPEKWCSDTRVYEWSWAGDAYYHLREELIDEKLISDCVVVNGKKPCTPNEIIYDGQNNLLIKPGDVFLDGSLMRALNPKAVILIPTLRHMRDGKVINSIDVETKKIISYKSQ